jgi:hypothetical protein
MFKNTFKTIKARDISKHIQNGKENYSKEVKKHIHARVYEVELELTKKKYEKTQTENPQQDISIQNDINALNAALKWTINVLNDNL